MIRRYRAGGIRKYPEIEKGGEVPEALRPATALVFVYGSIRKQRRAARPASPARAYRQKLDEW
jgi:hypothetical protein